MEKDNIVYIGKKGPMNYVLAVVTQFDQGSKDVILKARGRAISTAVDVAEISRNKFVTDISVTNIKIATEELQDENNDGPPTRVSAIEITLAKN